MSKLPWYAPARMPATPGDQLAWRDAVEEVASLTGDVLPRMLPNENTFTCAECKTEPTSGYLCCLCESGR